jgi:hypothetical protein
MVERQLTMMAHYLIRVTARSGLETFKMKCLLIIILIAIAASMLGCSSMAHIMQTNFRMQPSSDWGEEPNSDRHMGSFSVYTNNPYALHLEIEDTGTSGEIEQLNGDGGASLNAYAACLTLKVIF